MNMVFPDNDVDAMGSRYAGAARDDQTPRSSVHTGATGSLITAGPVAARQDTPAVNRLIRVSNMRAGAYRRDMTSGASDPQVVCTPFRTPVGRMAHGTDRTADARVAAEVAR
jgi:hypothetical protein